MTISLNLNETQEIKKDLYVDATGKTIIPEGYLYCMDCGLITPHFQGKHSKNCKICDCSNFEEEINCPNCGWETPELKGPHDIVVIAHNPGCHFEENTGDGQYRNEPCDNESISYQDRWSGMSWADLILQQFLENNRINVPYNHPVRKTICGCQRYTAYQNIHFFNYQERSVFSMDCSNAFEWSYTIRCLICGNLYEVCDSNC